MREEPAALVTSSTSLLLTTLFYSIVLFTRPLCDGSSALFGTIGTYSGYDLITPSKGAGQYLQAMWEGKR